MGGALGGPPGRAEGPAAPLGAELRRSSRACGSLRSGRMGDLLGGGAAAREDEAGGVFEPLEFETGRTREGSACSFNTDPSSCNNRRLPSGRTLFITAGIHSS